jgi:hypothetical protein
MTTREKAEQVLKGLPEEQVPVALEALERDARVLRMLRERHPQKSERELMETPSLPRSMSSRCPPRVFRATG